MPAAYVRTILIVFAFALNLLSQEKDFPPMPITPEGQFLELIDLEADPAKQLMLMDLFVAQFPKYNAMAAVYSEMQATCIKLSQFDRALVLGDKLLAIDQDDAEAVKLNLEAAEGKKDESLKKKWSDRLAQLTQNEPTGAVSASSVINTPFVDAPGAPGDNPKPGGASGTVSKQVLARMEAALFNKALQEKNPTVRLETLAQFSKQFPESQHLAKANYLEYAAYRQLGDNKKALAAAEQIVAKDENREDVLYFVAESYFAQKRELAKVIAYCSLILDLLNRKLKPDDMAEADWTTQKQTLTFQSHYMTGTSQLYQEHFALADKNLRLALADGKMSESTRAGILTSLGWSNYKIKNIPDSIKFYEQCAAIPGPFQSAAAQSVTSIKNEYGMVQ